MLATLPAIHHAHDQGVRIARLVVIEDNPHDVQLLRFALGELGLQVGLQVAEDATHAFALMNELSDPPALVVLDLNLPVIKGDAILREIRSRGPWREVPVIILTSSEAEGEIDRCLSLGATAFKTKPSLFEGYIAFARSLARYLT